MADTEKETAMDAQMRMEDTMDLPFEEPAGRKRPRVLGFVLVAALVLGAALFFLFSHDGGAGSGAAEAAAVGAGEAGDGEAEKAPVPVRVAEIATGPVSSYLSATANLVPDNQVAVLAEAEGRVGRLLVEEGDRVARGQVLASLAREDQEIALEKARLREENARLAFERGQRMLDESLISRETFEKLTMEHDLSRSERAEAQALLAKTTIRAPFGGRVTARKVDPGQHVRPGDELFTVADFEPLVAYVHLPEKEVLGLKAGRQVRITQKAAEDVRFRGRIRQISPVVDAATGTVKVTVEAVAPPASVRPGGFVTVEIVRETRPDAVLMPREAVLRELQSAHVFVVAEGKAERRDVTLGLEEGGAVQALSGVEPGDQVIVAGQGSLKAGAPVRVLETVALNETAGAAERVGRAGR
jgi:membrane fusion protein, multidrug efflux system